MASLWRDKKGWIVQFRDGCGKRRGVRIGKVPQRAADSIKARIEDLNSAAISQTSMDESLAKWVRGIGEKNPRLAATLARAGLIAPLNPQAEPAAPAALLGDFLDSFIAGRTDVRPNTVMNFNACKARLVEFFGRDKPLASITPGDADSWLVNLRALDYAPATIGRTVKRAKQFFRAAIRNRLLAENPFQDLKAPKQTNRDRKRMIDRDATAKVLAACPDAEWRLIFALSRFAGLRCPSEHLALKWADVDWERDRFLVHAPKTGDRWVPIFGELRPYLQEAFDAAPAGAVYAIARYRQANTNLRTQLERIIKRAGLTPWPKLFHNLRATRQTELAETFPGHVVCEWLGNSEDVAKDHYLQVTDDHFRRAAGEKVLQTGVAKVLQTGVATPASTCFTSLHHVAARLESDLVSGTFPAICADSPLPPRGREQSIKSLRLPQPGEAVLQTGVAVSADLARVIEAWPSLPESSRRAVLSIISQCQTD